MDLTTKYIECYKRFCTYLIANNIVNVDEDVLFLLLQIFIFIKILFS